MIPITVNCPACDFEVELPDGAATVTCPDCHVTWEVEPDADCENGVWRDMTRLTPLVTTEICSGCPRCEPDKNLHCHKCCQLPF